MLIALTEATRSQPTTLTLLGRRVLEAHFESTVASTDTDERYVVTPGNVVGAIRAGEDTIIVQPKIEIDRVLFMIGYASDPYRWQDAWAVARTSNDLLDGMATLFLHSSTRVLNQGLLRGYRVVDGDKSVIKGRIRWQRQARRLAAPPIAVRYHVHDDDIPENQVLRAAVSVLRRGTITTYPTIIGVARLWSQLGHLTPLADPLTAARHIVWGRQNEHYRPLIELAVVILSNAMADVGPGALLIAGFTIRLFDVFERFVRVALRELGGWDHQVFPDSWRGRGLTLAVGGDIPLNPDLGIRVDGVWRFVGDVKYKVDSGAGRDGDLYQVLAYATAAGLSRASLIYADGPPQPHTHQVRHSGVNLVLNHLDLRRHPEDVLKSLEQIAGTTRKTP